MAAFDPDDFFRGLAQPAQDQLRFVEDLNRQSDEQMNQLEQATQSMAATRAKKEREEQARHERAEEREIAQQQWNATLIDRLGSFMTKVEEDRVKNDERAAAAERRELEALEIARASKETAEKSKFWAVIAAIIAVVAILVSIVLGVALAPEEEPAPLPTATAPGSAPSKAGGPPSKPARTPPSRPASARPS